VRSRDRAAQRNIDVEVRLCPPHVVGSEVADAATVSTVSDRLASAKVAADAALAMLRQWAKDADANTDGDADHRGARR
jgi:hypothetical protein